MSASLKAPIHDPEDRIHSPRHAIKEPSSGSSVTPDTPSGKLVWRVTHDVPPQTFEFNRVTHVVASRKPFEIGSPNATDCSGSGMTMETGFATGSLIYDYQIGPGLLAYYETFATGALYNDRVAMMAYSIYTSDPATTPTPLSGSSPQIYTWQRRLQQLRKWKGDSALGEVNQISERALATASRLSVYAEQRFSLLRVRLTTVITPLWNGGVQVEWTVADTSIYHLEVEIPPDFQGHVALLRTRETLTGAIQQAYEAPDASMHAALAEVERLAAHAVRVASPRKVRR